MNPHMTRQGASSRPDPVFPHSETDTAPDPSRLLAAQAAIATSIAGTSSAEDLCSEVLRAVCEALGRRGGRAWLAGPDGRRRTVASFGEERAFGQEVRLVAGPRGDPLGALELATGGAGGSAAAEWLGSVGEQAGRAIAARAEAELELRAVQERLSRAEVSHRSLIENIPTVTYIADWDEHSSISYISPQVERITGYAPSEWLGASELWERRLHPEDRDRAIAEAARTFHEQREFDCEYRFIAADGRVVWIWERDAIIRSDDGTPLYSQGVMLDISRLREAEAALRASEELHRRSIAALHEAVFVHDAEGTIIACNASASRMLGLSEAEILGRGPGGSEFPFFHEDGTPMSAGSSPSMRVLATGLPLTDVVLRFERPDAEERWTTLNSQPVFADGGDRPTGVVTTLADITEQRRAQAEVAYLAYHDSLTGLPNRTLLAEHLELALARARRNGTSIALLYVDLDDFKLVNDSLGHQAGDEVLTRVAARLRESLRGSDLLARQGGDEFLVLVTDIAADAQSHAERIARLIARVLEPPLVVSGAEFHVTASVGISCYPRDADDAEALLTHADAAMYEVKSAGRRGHAVYSGDSREPLARLSLTTRLRRALTRDEFTLCYQPIVALADRSVVGLEALIRWEDGGRGTVMPAEFIPVAEETGLIESLGQWVLERACSQLQAWSDEGLHAEVAVNVSMRQLRRPDFGARLRRLLEAKGVSPAALTLEVTESTAMGEPQRIEPVLRELARAGVSLAIDDFGSGHSSLDRLRALPVEMLKIDRSFLRGVPEDPQAAAMVVAMIRLAEALGMTTIAEGVETAEQLSFLSAHGCPRAQGFHLGRPVAPESVAALLPRLTGHVGRVA